MDVSGKVMVITGGAQGIGYSIAQHFAKQKVKLVIGDVKKDELDKATKELKDAGAEVTPVECNVTNEDDAARLMKTAVDTYGRLDVAVLNAGVLRDGLLIRVDKESGKVKGKMSLEQWQLVIDVNLTGVFLTGREAAAQMIDAGNGGVIVVMSSIAGDGNFGQTNYAATKAGVRAMTVTWARELARYGIRVSAISPGFIGTPMVKRDMKQEALERILKLVPLRRLGEPDEVAQVVEFIIKNDFVTADNWGVTGGMRL